MPRLDILSKARDVRGILAAVPWRYYRRSFLHPKSEVVYTWLDVMTLTVTLWDESLSAIGLQEITIGELRRWCTTICEESCIYDFLKALDVVKGRLLSCIEEDNPKLLYYSTLKAELRANGLSVISISLLKPMLTAVVSNWTCDQFSTVFQWCYQCLVLPSRWNPFLYEDKKSECWQATYAQSLHVSANEHSELYNQFSFETFCKFVENNERLVAVRPASPYIQGWISDYLGGWLEHNNKPIPSEYFRFSGGATREFPRGTHELVKANHVAMHRDPYLLQVIEDLTGDKWDLSGPFSRSIPVSQPCDITLEHAQLANVPKSWKAFRSITKEPTGLVYYQQGLARSWREYYASHPELAGRYTAEGGPEVQRSKALAGSCHGRYATVDLSSASDSVSMVFFRSAFQNLPLTRQYLELGRTEYVDPPDELCGLTCPVKLNFFAGMGNPLTFNLEVCVFLAIGAEAVHECGGDFRHSILSVVGDDIIIEVKYYDKLVELLTGYGFIVNSDKSYAGSGQHRFRESCGTHALDGRDTTPANLPRDLQVWRHTMPAEVRKKRMSTIWPLQAVAIANDFRVKGLHRCRAVVLSILKERLDPMFYPPFCSLYEQNGVQSMCPTNFHLKEIPEEFVKNSKRFRRIWLNDTNTVYRRYGRVGISYTSLWNAYTQTMVPVSQLSSRERRRLDRVITSQVDCQSHELYWILRQDSDPRARWLAATGVSSNTSTALQPTLAGLFDNSVQYPLRGGPRLWWEATIGAFPR